MIFDFEERLSDSPFVARVWRTQSERPGDFLSVAASQWEMVVSEYHDETTFTVRGPETKATAMRVDRVGGRFFGIVFKYGAFMPRFPVSKLVNGALDLPGASSDAFWLNSSAWQFPDYENVESFVERLIKQELLVCNPIVEPAL